jgi:hypothetical protein
VRAHQLCKGGLVSVLRFTNQGPIEYTMCGLHLLLCKTAMIAGRAIQALQGAINKCLT